MTRSIVTLAILLAGLIYGDAKATPDDAQWPRFRGPLATGVAPLADPPVEWSEEKNIEWKTEIPGKGHSSPVVWNDRIFLTAAIPIGEELAEPKHSGRPGAHNNLPVKQSHRFVAICVDRKDGAILWERTLAERLPHEGGHETGSLASASPVVDAEHVFAFFGSHGLYCLDHEGAVIWKTDLGDQFTKHGHGEGASPALDGDTLVVNWDHEEESFVVAFEKSTGKVKWKNPRDEGTSWATPIIIEEEGKKQVIVSGTRAIRSYDLETGEVIWQCSGLADNVVASPVAEQGYVYAASSYTFQSMLAINLHGAHGDITDKPENVIWKRSKRTPYVPSPLLYDGVLYFLGHYQGILSRVVGKTGDEPSGPFRLPGLHEVYASPVAAAGRVYILDRSGVMQVLKHAKRPEPIATNKLNDRFSATPALVGKEMFLRGEKYLYCVRKD